MGKTFPELDQRNADFIRSQHVFFVATAPLGAEGHVNVSPKGLESFAILDPLHVAYLDLVGSGIETVAHLRENRRITILFCAFAGPPRLLRLYGRGEVVEPGDAVWDDLYAHFPDYPGARTIVQVELTRIADSCGFGVPRYRFEGERDQLQQWSQSKGSEHLDAYKAEHNSKSLDGLPGLRNT